MAIGMTYEQFWYGDANMVIAFRKAEQLKMEALNRNMWLQGMYFYEALCDVSPIFRSFSKAKKPMDYRHEPFELNVSSEEKKEVQKRTESRR